MPEGKEERAKIKEILQRFTFAPAEIRNCILLYGSENRNENSYPINPKNPKKNSTL
jgi:hypothetical protein